MSEWLTRTYEQPGWFILIFTVFPALLAMVGAAPTFLDWMASWQKRWARRRADNIVRTLLRNHERWHDVRDLIGGISYRLAVILAWMTVFIFEAAALAIAGSSPSAISDNVAISRAFLGATLIVLALIYLRIIVVARQLIDLALHRRYIERDLDRARMLLLKSGMRNSEVDDLLDGLPTEIE